MKKKIFILIVSLVLLPMSIYGITSSGTVSSNNKTALFPVGDPACLNDKSPNFENSVYYSGSVFLSDSNTSEEAIDEKNFVISKEIYHNKVTAEEACSTFITSDSNKSKTLLCKEPKQKIAYLCSGELKDLNDNEKYLEPYLTGKLLFDSEENCKKDCKGSCSLSSGYNYQYVEVKDSNINGKIEQVGGRMFQDASGNYAYCIQPDKDFQCPTYYGSVENMNSQYCLNTEFELSDCKNNYWKDYRCGLAYIALVGTNNKKTLTPNEYGVIDTAMRMWAARIGGISGVHSTLRLPGSKTTTINFYAITAQKVKEDANYLENGLVCSNSSRNNGVLCTDEKYDINLYKDALELYYKALTTNTLDASGNKIPRLISKTLRNTGNTIQVTNPTETECKVNDPNCRVTITLYDRNGNIIEANSKYCDKEKCYAVYKTERLCVDEEDTVARIVLEIKDFDASGSVKHYKHCTNPEYYQNMFVIEASGTETTQKLYYNKYDVGVACGCEDDSVKLKATVSKTNSCKNKEKANSDKSDYDGVDTSYIKDPSMTTILNSCEGEKYFRATEFNTNPNVCKIYCRNEIEINTPTKTRVYSGMQFRYELENKVSNSLKSDYHITSIVRQKKHCVSEIYYDEWKKEYDSAQSAVVKAWDEWKKWEVMAYEQERNEKYPTVTRVVSDCSANCEGLGNNSLDSDEVCGNHAAGGFKQLLQVGEWEAGKICNGYDKVNKIGSNICKSLCAESYTWSSQTYNTARNGKKETGDVKSEGSVGNSILSCFVNVSGMPDGLSYICDTAESASCKIPRPGYTCTPIDETRMQCVRSGKSISVERQIGLTQTKSQACNKLISDNKLNSASCSYTSKGSCDSKASNGDIEMVINKAESARNAYNDAQVRVRELLNDIQKCNFYGSGVVEGEPDIKYYTLTTGASVPTGPGGGVKAPKLSGGNNATKVGNGESGATASLSKTNANVKNVSTNILDSDNKYETTTMLNTSDNYNVSNVGTTSNKDSIKGRILSAASCLDGNCPDLIVEYGQEHYGKGNLPKEQYGVSQQYKKTVGVVDNDELSNRYCSGNKCYCKGSNCSTSIYDEELENKNGWTDKSKTAEISIIVCDVSKEPSNQTCTVKKESVPANSYVSFKATVEIDFYRHNSYYAEVYTGNIIDSNTNITLDNKNYTKLGSNIYPITNDSYRYKDRNITHKVKYSFSNLGIGNFSSDTVNIDKYDYECSYEVYNNTTGYDCVENCNNECLEINENVPDLSCIEWGSSGPKNYGFTFRNVDLSDLFPNDRKPGFNWSKSEEIINRIQDSSKDIYKNSNYLELSVTLDANAIKKIREYNKLKSDVGGYQDNSLSDCKTTLSADDKNMRFANCRSSFIDELDKQNGALGIKVNKIVRNGGEIK